MIAHLYRRSLLLLTFVAAASLALGLAACGEKEQKPAASLPAAPAAPAATNIGKFAAFEGNVRLIDRRGERPAQTGMEIEEGDTVKAGPNAWALLAMSDGASITMRSDSELRFDNYRYAPDGDASQNSAAMYLVKGAMRSITGLVGQTNRGAYQIKTQTATIGIRGTDHEPAYYPPPAPGEKGGHPPGTYDKVNEGESVIHRPTGEVAVKRGQTAFAHQDVKVRPQILSQPPAFYRQHAQLDQRVADRRAEFHRQFEEQRQRQIQERRLQQDALKKAQEQQKDKRQLEQQKQQDAQRKKQDELKALQDKQRAEQQKKAQQQKDQKKVPGGKDDKKGVPAKDEKKGPAKDEKKAPAKDEKKAATNDDRKAVRAEKKALREEQKAALPPSVQERVKNMQRGDRGATPAQQRQEQRTQEQQKRQQPVQPQQQARPQQQPRLQQQQQQRQGRQQPQQQDEKKKRQRSDREER